jgi:glycosyltransferase involved in cell wall biosynthesis
MRTTANRIGLERFLAVVWPQVCAQMAAPPELWIVGDLSGISTDMQRQLEQAGAICTGFAPELTTVLRPYDIHIMPWEHNTGTRTRLPVIFNFAQVLVATSAAAACVPEAQHGTNALLIDALPDMAAAIVALCADDARRKQIGQAARRTFEQSFVRAALQPQFDHFIEQCLQAPRTPPAREAEKIPV